ncbi:MAG: MoxR family ATPase [Trueperaceae bacterium]|nr:MoxR family ATPase [Trueperaceae bacterium]
MTDELDVESLKTLEADLQSLSDAKAEISQAVVGQSEVVEQLLASLMCGGHALIEGAPGLGKTLLVKTLAEVLGLQYSRVQFTPDLMPADITGTMSLTYEDGRPSSKFQPGPIFAQLVLADEINRATPKTQASLLEAMQEHTATVAGVEHRMLEPFFVLATQNPFEMDGTYALPEAQIDRFFFKVQVEHPSVETLVDILDLTTGTQQGSPKRLLGPEDVIRIQKRVREVPTPSHVKHLIARFVRSTLPNEPSNSGSVRKYVRFGVSPRGAQALALASKARALLSGRFNSSVEDVRAVLVPALRHRLQLNYQGTAEGISIESLLKDLFEAQVLSATSLQ